MKKVIYLLALSTLFGCTTTSLQTKDYSTYAEWYSGLQKCSNEGNLPKVNVALETAYLNEQLTHWSYNKDQLDAEINYQNQRPNKISKTSCSDLLSTLQANRQKSIRANQPIGNVPINEASSTPNNMPKQTICNRVGTQTFCSTY